MLRASRNRGGGGVAGIGSTKSPRTNGEFTRQVGFLSLYNSYWRRKKKITYSRLPGLVTEDNLWIVEWIISGRH